MIILKSRVWCPVGAFCYWLVFLWARNCTPIASATQLLSRENIVYASIRAWLKSSLLGRCHHPCKMWQKNNLPYESSFPVACNIANRIQNQHVEQYQQWSTYSLFKSVQLISQPAINAIKCPYDISRKLKCSYIFGETEAIHQILPFKKDVLNTTIY